MIRRKGLPVFDRIMAWSGTRMPSPVVRYLLATLAIVFVAVARVFLVTSLLPWLLFIPVIIAIGLMLARGPAIYGSILAAVLAAVSIGNAAEPWWMTGAQWAGSVLFLMIAIGLSLLSDELREGIRQTHALNAELAEREAFMASVLASSTDCIKVLGLDGRLIFMSEGGQKVMEISDFGTVEGCPWPDFWQDEGNAEAIRAIEAAREGRSSHFIGQADTFTGSPRWWDVSVSPIPGPDGRPARILSVSRDMSALMEAQQQQRLLNGELSHRLKNVLALVQSIANQTFRKAESIVEANRAFAERLAALGKATDVLTATAWQKATLHEVSRAGLTSIDGLMERVHIEGPPMELGPQLALALTLALHELATNACKYGALSNETGTVLLIWTFEPAVADRPGRFSLLWKEAGGPPVAPPVRRGFGSRMIEQSLRSYFQGDMRLQFDPAGVVFRVEAPIEKAGAIIGD